jgi:RimJ/RimL family protein N-acetyltransferase
VIEGDRVRLRPWSGADAPFVFDMYSQWGVQRFLGPRPRLMEDRAAADALITRLMAVDDPIRGYWAVENVTSGELLGTVMIQGIRRSGATERSEELEIGWHFHPNSWGHGYATSAAQLLTRDTFASGVDRLIAVVRPGNSTSIRVCQRLGMEDAGVTDHYYDVSCHLFVLERKSWLASAASIARRGGQSA